VEQCTARCRPPAQAGEAVVVEDGFLVVEGELEIPHPAELRRRPVRLLTAFAVAQQRRVSLSRAARRMIRAQLDLVDDSLRRDPEAAATLLRILDSEHRVMRSLMEMNEVGLLGRFLPEWEHIVCRWQHVMYHTYTVDVHSIFLVEELRRLWRGKYEAALPELTQLMRSVTDRPALFLGCLLHDIGKGRGGDHSNRGEALARVCLERLGLPEARRERVAFLVRTHLLMSHVAQRRDLADPKVIVEFARMVGDRENLRNLHLLTFADTRASSAGAWTEWKGQLLRELYERTAEFLESGRDDPSRALEQIEARVERRRDAARAELRALGVGEPKIDAFFAMMPRRYFVAHTPRQIARHARLVLGFGGARRMASAVREMRGGFTEFLFCAPDQHGLYALVAGTLTASGLNIIGSHVYTTRTGLALEVYRVSTPPGGPDEKALAWSEFETLLLDVLEGRRDLGALLRARRRPVGRPTSPSRQPPSVHVSNEEADLYTIVDVAANDRMGLLYDLVRTIADHGLEIYISKATTILDQAADTFYVRDAAGKKLGDPARLAALERDLLAVAGGEAADG
jgi:[protein-PII] uridylyltransferase